MPKFPDIKKVLLLGSGPIVIGQACEFDYSGVQACRVLKEEGCQVVLVNSNPATIMTDPELADATYIEPISWEIVAKIIERERPDAILPTMGGQTALNCALDLAEHGILEKYQVKMIGASEQAINKAEDRQLFREAMQKIGLQMPKSIIVRNMEEAHQALDTLNLPLIIRPSFTLGGSGGGIAYNREEYLEICARGLSLSPIQELQIDESIIGWKEYELEVVRDRKDNCIIVCSIENFDPMGVHTGDSITIAPAQTLTDKEYQLMRNAAIKILREIGVDTGGSNVQFAVNPKDGTLMVIEMNPRVSRSSALASKATGFPIAKVATKLALGYTLDELKNEITNNAIPASFEPTIDYVVVKIPRFNFDKFVGTDTTLTTQMKSVGEVMGIGQNFLQALNKAIRSLEIKSFGLENKIVATDQEDLSTIFKSKLRVPNPERLWYIADAFRHGYSIEEIQQLTHIDPWFLHQIQFLINTEINLSTRKFTDLSASELKQLKQLGFSDAQLAKIFHLGETAVRNRRIELEVKPTYKRIDSCAAEFPTQTGYLYATYENECEAHPVDQKKIIILGSGPNRIGQGIEFDYSCVHAVMALREAGYQTIMINCNPETVSTDYDIADKLYFEPLTLEDVLAIIQLENPIGVVVQFGGQTPLKLAKSLQALNIPILGTKFDAIDQAEDRERFQKLLAELKIPHPANASARETAEALNHAEKIGYPVMVRPSYVLGGRAMEIVYHAEELTRYMQTAIEVSDTSPVLLDKFLEDAIEVDVDAVSDGENVYIGGIMEHIEQAGVHSGDSACVLPSYSLSQIMQREIAAMVTKIAKALKVVGLINAQLAVKGEDIYVLEVNPRAARTVPFVAKATGVPLAKLAARCLIGEKLPEKLLKARKDLPYYAIKQVVFPFDKFANVDTILGPEMKSTGEVMGIGKRFGEAFNKGQLGIGVKLPHGGKAFISVRDADKPKVAEIAKMLHELNFQIVATRGTAALIEAAGIPCERVNKVAEGRPHIVDMIKSDEIDFIVNTSKGKKSVVDATSIRRNALLHKVSYTTTLAGAKAMCLALKNDRHIEVIKLQELFD